jgi:hypothetical protein
MSDPETLIRPILVGNPRYPRYAISVDHSPFTPTLYWNGKGDDPWTDEVCDAMKWADYGKVMTMIRGMLMAT